MRHPVRAVVTIYDERDAMRHARGRVSIVDDDTAVRSAVAAVLSDEGYAVAEFASAEDFIAFEQRAEPLFPGPSCVLVDVRMPGMSGLELQQRLAPVVATMAIVFMSGGSSAAEAVQALKGSAMDFLVKPFDDEELATAVSRALARSAERERTPLSARDIARRLAPRLSLVGDQTQLQQVILNLLNNAIEALRESAVVRRLIHVETSARDGGLLLEVSDNGIGIPDDHRDSVFELLKSTKARGMGVGLWLSKTVVNAHRGDIRFTREAGKGTCFDVWLPFAETGDLGLDKRNGDQSQH